MVPTEDEIEWAVRRLRNNLSGGPSIIRAEHLKGWLEEVRKAEATAVAKEEDEEEEEDTTGDPEEEGADPESDRGTNRVVTGAER